MPKVTQIEQENSTESEMELLGQHMMLHIRIPTEAVSNYLKKIMVPPIKEWCARDSSGCAIRDEDTVIDTIRVFIRLRLVINWACIPLVSNPF